MTSCHIDWYSFTASLKKPIDVGEYALDTATNAVRYLIGDYLFKGIFLHESGWELGNGRRPYKMGYENREIGMSVWFGGQTTVLVEFSGKGCAWLSQRTMLMMLIAATHHRTTRIDIAVDVDGVNLVKEIKEGMNNGRITTFGYAKSPTGHTEYIGNRKSDKFCRVYAYTSPDNPRYGSTRVEYEHKGKQSRITSRVVLDNGVPHTAAQIAEYYKWNCAELHTADGMVEKIPSVQTDRAQSKRIEWLQRQVKPAIRNMIEDLGIENPQEWLIAMLLPVEYRNDNNE